MNDKLNLNKSSVDFYWKSQDPRMLKILSMMEAVEPWVVDDVEFVAKELISFGRKMNGVSPEVLTSRLSNKSSDITTIMTYIFSGKSMRLLNWIDDNFPGLSFHYIMEARHREEDDWEPGKLLLDRLKTIKTLSLMGLIFAPMRTKLISSLLEDSEDD